jgi:hypothetical protein
MTTVLDGIKQEVPNQGRDSAGNEQQDAARSSPTIDMKKTIKGPFVRTPIHGKFIASFDPVVTAFA